MCRGRWMGVHARPFDTESRDKTPETLEAATVRSRTCACVYMYVYLCIFVHVHV